MDEIKNATIESVSLSKEEHNCLTVWVHLNYGGSGQGFGGYALYLPKSFKHHKINSLAGHFIWRVMEIADVCEWDNLAGKTIRVDIKNDLIKGIGHIIKDDWFYPEKDFS